MNVGKSKVMVCEEIHGERMEQMHEFEYLGSMVNHRSMGNVDCENKVMNGRNIARAIETLVIKRGMSMSVSYTKVC